MSELEASAPSARSAAVARCSNHSQPCSSKPPERADWEWGRRRVVPASRGYLVAS